MGVVEAPDVENWSGGSDIAGHEERIELLS